MLREDPGYFAEIVDEARAHCRDRLQGYNEAQHVIEHYWNFALHSALADAYKFCAMWGYIEDRLEELCTLNDTYPEVATGTGDVPDAYSRALHHSSYLMSRAQGAVTTSLSYGIYALHGRLFKKDNAESGPKIAKEKDFLFKLLAALTDKAAGFRIGT